MDISYRTAVYSIDGHFHVFKGTEGIGEKAFYQEARKQSGCLISIISGQIGAVKVDYKSNQCSTKDIEESILGHLEQKNLLRQFRMQDSDQN